MCNMENMKSCNHKKPALSLFYINLPLLARLAVLDPQMEHRPR